MGRKTEKILVDFFKKMKKNVEEEETVFPFMFELFNLSSRNKLNNEATNVWMKFMKYAPICSSS